MLLPAIFNIYDSGLIAAISDQSDGNLSLSVGDSSEIVLANRAALFGRLGVDLHNVAFSGQIHGDAVVHVSSGGRVASCDAMFTAVPDLALAVSIADCLAILMFDPVTKTIAGVHSGWRGSAARIVQKTIEGMNLEGGVEPKNLIAFISPGAGVCCYEVGEEVAAQFPAENVDRISHAKPHLDLKSFNRTLLIESGLAPANIGVSPECTICARSSGLLGTQPTFRLGNPEFQYHSFRRDGARSGRMLAIIGKVATNSSAL
jgi:YfiH family protein